MRQAIASICTLLLSAVIALALDSQTKAEIGELITYVETSGVRFIRNGTEYSGAGAAQHHPVRLTLIRYWLGNFAACWPKVARS